MAAAATMALVPDTSYIAQAYSIPETTLATLLDAPTVEHVRELLEKIEARAREYEDATAEKLRVDVELETAVRSGNARAKQLKDAVEKGLKETEELRRKLAAEETARANVESELQNLKSSSSNSSSQVEAFQSRIASLESANRDALSLLESKSTAHDNLAEELSAQHQKIVALRREVSELESKVQSADNASMQFKFREQRLQEEVELLKKRDEWHDEELKRRTTEHTKYRKEKTAQVGELQRSIEDVTQANETLRSTETQLRNRLDEVTRKLEDAYAQLQSKDEEAVRRDNSSRAERDNALRLAELQKKSAETARARQQELERAMDQLKEDAATEIGNLQADVNAERMDKETAERRVEELERRVDEVQTELATFQEQGPTTPRRSLNGVSAVHATPGRAVSPFTPGASRLKAGMTMTQMVSEYSKLKADLDHERRTANELRATLDGMITDLENKQPEMDELLMDRDRLQAELDDASALLEQSHQDRDEARKTARLAQSSAHALEKQSKILQQQLRDLSFQIKLLLVEIQAREHGLDNLTPEQQAQYEALARNEIDEAELEGQSPNWRFISTRLVGFRTVEQLQKLNAEQLYMLRQLGEEQDGEEARARKEQTAKDKEELEALRQKVVEYKDSIQSLTTRSESYIRERDMFRRMLAHRGQLPQGVDPSTLFGQSLDGSFLVPATPSRAPSTEPSADARALADHIKLLKELQQHFDAYREEAATDLAALKRQSDALSREKSEMQGENARLMSREAVAQERYALLQSNFGMLKTENAELQRRAQGAAENAARQDLRTQQVAEELVEARSLAESMRNETANLKAEKDLWRNIEARLTDEAVQLREERSRLNKMVSDLQSLQNEREIADSETRRRLAGRAETLEAELATAKRKLDEEVEQAKKAALRREYETEQNRVRIEDLLKSSANYKEELVVVKTQRDQLQARVDEMKIELRNAEEKAVALQPRLTSRPGASQAQNDENALSREQELGVEVADLKRDLELKEAQLQTVQDEIEQYKAIAQTAEEELGQMNETSDAYRQETDGALAEKDAKIAELEKRVEEISAELATTNSELSELRGSQDEAAAKFNDQKAIYESELARLRDESDRLAETARLHQEDLKAQAEIAQQAQQNYEDELVKHAEAASGLQKMRTEHNALKTEVAGFRAEADAAKMSLERGEESWAETKGKYEQEVAEIKNSREELRTQNRRLHTQLEDLSKQIDGLKASRAATAAAAAEDDANATPTPQDATSSNLQEIIRYLRQEKEIVDMQYELQIQESKRLGQQLAHAQAQLDDAREKLETERRGNAAASEQATSHSKLMQTINELNLFRESNSSLRNEARAAQDQLAKKIKEVEELVAQLEPLRTKAREAEYELEARQGEVKLLQEDRDRWQKRTQDIMQKYDRVDPAELAELREQIASLTAERDAAVAEKVPLQEQIDDFNRRLEEGEKKFSERIEKFKEQAKGRDAQRRETIAQKQALIETGQAELATLKEDLEGAKRERDEAVQALANAKTTEDDEEGQVTEKTTPAAAPAPVPAAIDGDVVMTDGERALLESQIAAAEEKAAAEAARAAALEQEILVLNGRFETLKAQISELESLAAANARADEATQNITGDGASSEELERLQAALTAAQEEVSRLKADPPAAPAPAQQADPLSQEQIEAAIEEKKKELAEQLDKAKREEELYAKRTQQMKNSFNTKMREAKEKFDAEMAAVKTEHEQELKKVKAEPGVVPDGEVEATPAAIAVPTTNGSSTPAAAEAKPAGWQPSEDEVRELVRTSPLIKGVIKTNIEKQVHLKVEETKKAAETEREKAVNAAKEMAEKRSAVKLNMANNKANTLTAQIDVVRTAATDTPARPVGEVWEIAKNTKPGGTVAPKRQSILPGGPAAATPAPQQATPAAAPASTAPAQQQPQLQPAPTPAPAAGGFGAPSALPQAARRPSGIAAPFGAPSALPTPGANPFVGAAPNATPAPAANQAGAGRGQTNTGTGPAALKAVAQNHALPPAPVTSGIPRPGSAMGGPTPAGQAHAARGRGGSQLPRGGAGGSMRGAPANRGGSQLPRGGGAGRGGLQTSGLPGAGGRGGASPRGARGGMNPGAAGFVPGAKRPNDGTGGNEEKRVKEGIGQRSYKRKSKRPSSS